MADIQQKRDKIVQLATTDIYRSAMSLFELANKHAIDEALKEEAIMLGMEINVLTNEKDEASIKAAFQQKITTLADKIVHDANTNPEKQQVVQTEQKVRDYFIQKRLQNDIIFQSVGMTKSYRKKKAVAFTLAPIDLTLRLGEIMGLVGENGNGKTTLLKIIAGIHKADGGNIQYPFFGPQLNWGRIKQKVAYIPQRIEPWHGKVEENLHFAAAAKGIMGKENDKRLEYIIHRLGLQKHRDKKWKELSGGYQMRFELAKMLIWQPNLLILDEPLANLDIKAQQQFLNDLRNLTHSIKHPLSVIISSQHLHKVESVSDHIVFLSHGKALFNGPMTQLGEDRTANCFELSCNVSSYRLKAMLKNDLTILKIQDDGPSILIYTPLSVSQREVLSVLIKHPIDIQNFRDISKSTRLLFEKQ